MVLVVVSVDRLVTLALRLGDSTALGMMTIPAIAALDESGGIAAAAVSRAPGSSSVADGSERTTDGGYSQV